MSKAQPIRADQQSQKNEISKKINKKRMACVAGYLLASLVPIFYLWSKMFYPISKADSWNVYRFWWSFSNVYLGFAAVAYVWRKEEKSPFPEYVTMYPFQLLAICALVFGGLHLFPATSSYLFYFLSFGIGFTIGFMVDSYWGFVTSFFSRANKS